MVKTLDILKDIAIHFSNHNFKIFLAFESELLDINTMATVSITQLPDADCKIVNLQFEVMGNTTIAGMITKVLYDFCVKNSELRIVISDPYHLIFDKNGKYVDSLFGSEALDYAEAIRNDDNSKEIEQIKKVATKKVIIEDQQEKIDRLLDQISKDGVNSLTEGERHFLAKLK